MVELITDYLEGALDEQTRTRFEAHLTDCDGCTAYLEQMRETIRLVGRLEETAVPADARANLMAAFRDWKAGQA